MDHIDKPKSLDGRYELMWHFIMLVPIYFSLEKHIALEVLKNLFANGTFKIWFQFGWTKKSRGSQFWQVIDYGLHSVFSLANNIWPEIIKESSILGKLKYFYISKRIFFLIFYQGFKMSRDIWFVPLAQRSLHSQMMN